ncbi:AraC family transcriptional regulator [Pseudomonas extremorientalis]|uniref:AraC family transcriptional regulator n=2 Tax=Pseudomonas extremorientalis TaxID=169669 RepID=A0A1H0VCJ9_9PSED|nr:AraC family transcriptional regulator [Pseudomonas extremorientalis]OIN11434.1 AraC family transcriptional regulator [Pseudomonas extremorientalis]SDP76299.1 transcriptional regulator, AraC family [Pseudomonas extremorientalis]
MTTKSSVHASRAEYARRMNRVLNYIDTHLDTPLEGARLADIANFSRFHFHRIFAAWMGETLGSYVRRRRLEKAAFRLSCGNHETVLETALASGFNSGEAFARAFKLQFGCTPSEWRTNTPQRLAAQAAAIGPRPGAQQSNPDQVFGNAHQAHERTFDDAGLSSPSTKEPTMDVRIIDLPKVRVAYQRLIGPYGPAIGHFWRGTMAPWMHSNGLGDERCYGIGYDDPSITPPNKCRYDACVEVPASFLTSAQADIQTLPGGRYAVASFKGKTEKIADAWMWLTREWMPSSGLQCDDRPCFEMFFAATATDSDTGEFICDICIPVRSL